MSRRPHLLRSRRALGWTAGVYCAIQAAVLGMVLFIPWMREPVYGRKVMRLRSRLEKEPRPPLKIVVAGSSRTLNGLRGDLIEPALSQRLGRPTVVFNMGIPGGGCVSNLLHLRRLLNDGIPPDIVVLEVFLPSLFGDGPMREVKGESWQLPALRRGELGLVRRYAGDRHSTSHADWLLARSNPLTAHRFGILSNTLPMILSRSSLQNDLDQMDGSGWFAAPANPDAATRRHATEKMLESYQSALKKPELSPASLRPLHEALLLCKERNISAVLLLMPEGPLFRSLYPPGVREQSRAMLAEAGKAWGVPLIDAGAWFEDEAAFIDSHHQLPETAAAFTHRLGRELLSLPAVTRGRQPAGETR